MPEAILTPPTMGGRQVRSREPHQPTAVAAVSRYWDCTACGIHNLKVGLYNMQDTQLKVNCSYNSLYLIANFIGKSW